MQGPTGRLACPACDAVWPAATARFCGSCGAPLPTPDVPAPDDPGTHAPPTHAPDAPTPGPGPGGAASRRPVVLMGAVGIVVGLLLVTSLLDPGWSPSDPQREVVLPDEGAVPTGSPLAAIERDAWRAQAATDRLRCEPRGCERWRYPADPDDEVVGGSGMVVIFGDDGLLAVDGSDGRPLWTDRLDGLVPVTGDGDRIGGLRRPGITQLLVDDTGVVVTIGSRIVAFDPDGHRRWMLDLLDWQPEQLTVLDDLLVLQSWLSSGGPHVGRTAVVGIDRGDVRWEREATATTIVATSGIVVATESLARQTPDAFVSLDPRTGEVQWERLQPNNAWLTAVGPWLLVHDPVMALIDARTGQDEPVLGGRVVQDPVQVGERWVLVVDPAADEGAREVVAVDSEGEILWRHPVPADDADRCCVEMVAFAADVVVVGADADRFAVEVSTGRIVPLDDDLAAGLLWVSPGGSMVRHDATGLVVVDPDGASFSLPGEQPWWFASLDDPWVLGGPDELLGVQPVFGG